MISNKYLLTGSLLWCSWIFLFLTSCSSWKDNQISFSTSKKLSREIVAKKLVDRIKDGTEPIIFVDSSLKERLTIFNRGEFFAASTLFPDLFYPDQQQHVFSFVIPNGLAHKIRYIDSKADIENGPGTFFFFSPLLPTKKKDVFAMQVYSFETIRDTFHKDETLIARFASRYYDLYMVKKRHAHYLETISAPEDFFNLPFLKFD